MGSVVVKEVWKSKLADSICNPDDLPSRLKIDRESVRETARRFPVRITPYFLGLIKEKGDPIWRQCIPDRRELEDDQHCDPLNEEGLSPVSGLIHRYPDRVVWLVTAECAVYCRFCMRKSRLGCKVKMCSEGQCEDILEYIAGNVDIRDVILSGGDPLLLDDDALETILKRLRSIRHVEIIRIGSRAPVTLPERITAKLCRMLKRYHPIFINTHFNHPWEITPESSTACAKLADAGIPLGNQTVLLRGVNDDPQVMKRLMQQLLTLRVRPYYIHQMDLVRGTRHFRTSVDTGIRIIESMRGHTSGLANPFYVIDLPGGKGKVPLFPECLEKRGNVLQLTNYLGEIIQYDDLED